MTILDVYRNGNSMYETAKKCGVSLDEVRKVVLKNRAQRYTARDRIYVEEIKGE